MIRFYDSTGEQHPITHNDIENFYLLHEADGSVRLSFNISSENRFYNQIVEESEIEYGDNCYIVKKVKNGKIECDLNFDFLKKRFYKAFSSDSVLLSELLSAHLPDDWTVINAELVKIRRTTVLELCTDCDIIMSAMATYGVYFEWFIKSKTLKIYLQSEAENTGEYLTDQLNLRNISMQGDTLTFATRLYAYGKDGLSFASINDGKEYVDSTEYADKIICAGWSDERYTIPSELLAAAKEKLKTLSFPVRAYECDVIDLAKLNPKYSFLNFKLHKAVMLLDREHGIRVQHRIVQYKEYPFEPTRNVVTLSSVPQKISTRVSNLATSIEENKQTTNAYQKASVALSELISNSLGVYYTEVKDETGASHYYLHDQPSLENSSTIYTHNAGGYAFTNSGWNNGSPNWQYGFTKDGNAIFNKVCAYGLNVVSPDDSFSAEISPSAFKIWQDGVLKLDAYYNGLNIYDGAITIYKGVGVSANKVLYFDSDGNASFAGYLTQPGSSVKAIVGKNQLGNPGFFIYQFEDYYKRPDGTYLPYMELWRSANNYSVLSGVTQLRFIVKSVSEDNQSVFLKGDESGGSLYGKWAIGGDYSDAAGTNITKLTSSNITANQLSARGTIYLRDESTTYASLYQSTNGNIVLKSERGTNLRLAVGDDVQVDVSSGGGILYGAWDFGQEQNFSNNINAPSFICKSNGSKVMSLYISTTYNPCFNSDNGKDYYFSVGGNTRLAIRTSGGDMYGSWQINTESGYVSLYTDQTGAGGGKLWGTWYLGNSTAITSDANKKNSVEKLPEKYEMLFNALRPVRYKYNDGTSDRYHTGFIAQEVEQALNASEIDTQEFAGFVKNKDGECFLRYEEFIALTVNEIQLLKKQNAELENKLNSVIKNLEV